MPKVGIVISNYNGWQDTLVCLDSLQKQTYKDFEIILLDDASPNDSVAQLQDKLPANTVFLPQEQNLGFAAVNNVGMRRALADGCDYVLLLNNDTAVAPDMLETLLRETPAGAVSCPKMLFLLRHHPSYISHSAALQASSLRQVLRACQRAQARTSTQAMR